MPSTAVKLLMIIYMISIIFVIMIPEAGIGTQLVNKFVNTSSQEGIGVSEDINSSLPKKPTGVLSGVNSFITPIQMVWRAVELFLNIITAPVAIANYMIAVGAPWEAVVLALSPFIVAIFGALVDFVRSGG